MTGLAGLVERAVNRGASDIHLVCGMRPMCRVDGQLVALNEETLTPSECEQYAEQAAGTRLGQLAPTGQLDLALSFPGGVRTRVNLFRQQGSTSMAMRILSNFIPTPDALGLPPTVEEFSEYRTGIVLVTGETGSGKSTTLASLIDRINHSRTCHILTLEDPVEYIYTPDKCIINQREIGRDTSDYPGGLRAALREDPDVILIGEMRDLPTIETALIAAETGHLVLSTLHTNSAADSIDRIVSVFPEGRQNQIRMQLSTTLRAVLSQQLIPGLKGGRVAACEVMIVTDAIKNLIREGKTPQIANFITMGSHNGSVSMDNALLHMMRDGLISAQSVRDFGRDREYINKHL